MGGLAGWGHTTASPPPSLLKVNSHGRAGVTGPVVGLRPIAAGMPEHVRMRGKGRCWRPCQPARPDAEKPPRRAYLD
jgi:hypothetical protein